MSVVVVGLNHRTVPLDLFERMTVPLARVPKALADLTSREHVTEAVVLSTCNRIEVYAFAERYHGAYQDIRNFFAEASHVPPEEFSDHLVGLFDGDAARHLFSVASGLESAVLGEHEILGQVRMAWETAATAGAVGPVLNPLFRHALEVGNADGGRQHLDASMKLKKKLIWPRPITSHKSTAEIKIPAACATHEL